MEQKSGCANHPGEPQISSATSDGAGVAAIGGGSAITAVAVPAERSAASTAAVMAPYGFPVVAPQPLASTAYAMGATPMSPYGYLPPPPPPQLHPSYFSGALPIPPPPPPQEAASTLPASFYYQQQMPPPPPPMPMAAASLVATQTMGTQSSATTTVPAVSDSSEDSDSNNRESAQKEDVASTTCSSTVSSSDSASDASGPGSKAKVVDAESKLEKANTDNSEKPSCESSSGSSQDSSGTASTSSDGIARTDLSTGKIKSNSESTNENADDCDEKSTAYNSIDGSPMDDILSLSSDEAHDDKVGGQNALEEEDLGQPNVDGDPLLDVPSAISSAVSSRAISPILGPNDFGGDNSTSSPSNDNNGSPRVAARASDREFSGDTPDGSEETQADGDHSLTEKSKPAAMVATKKEEDLPPLGQEQHLDEPEEFAWLRPYTCVQARGGYHDDPEKSMTNATVVSYPAPAGELLDLDGRERGAFHYDEKTKWYIRIQWVMSCYKEWLPCEWCRKEFGRGERKRTTTNRYTTVAIAAAKRNDLLKKSAPQNCSVLGSKSCPIVVDGDDDDGDASTEIPRTKRKLASISRFPQREKNTQVSQNHKRSRQPIVNSSDIISEWEEDLILFVRGEKLRGGKHGPGPAASAKAAPLFADDHLDICCECKQLEDPNSCIKMLLCDGCNAACHLPCTHDHLDKVPRNEWYCRSCWSLRESRRTKGRDDNEPVTFCELQARLKQLEEEKKGLKYEVTAMKEAELVYQSELLELRRTLKSKSSSRSSPKKRRPSGGRSSAVTPASRSTTGGGDAETEEKRTRPKRESGDIAMRRSLLMAFQVVDDENQSDPTGCGVIARRLIKAGELFEDRNVTYEEGPPPPSLDQWRYIALGSDERSTGYFRLANSHMEMINQPLQGQEANVKWYCSMYQEEGCPARKILRIKALRDIQKGEEILVVYRSI